MDIYVGSIPFKWKESRLREIFEQYGEVASAKIIIDKITRQNKGFAFVQMPNDAEAKLAIESLNGAEIDERKIVVNESMPNNAGSLDKNKKKKPFVKPENKEWKPFRGNNKGRRD
ncbi:RNA recognition motif domain-containing protein [Arcicella rigui]|uniref:RNA-binding protein n=1 Tax=Arcicella rigui TaxID=797020 RepID=A0ABU5QDH7_9BACT|nr:RNA-binding protein [Arcicella rigui]MEA5140798.1 RNA-binding protein [Arcicella rigui]